MDDIKPTQKNNDRPEPAGQAALRAASYAAIVEKAEQRRGGGTVELAGERAASYSGPIVESTAHHRLQQVGPKQYVAHVDERLAVGVARDVDVTISYAANRETGKVTFNAPAASRDAERRHEEAKAFLTQPRDQAESNPRLVAAYRAFDALQDKAIDAAPRNDSVERSVDLSIRQSIAARLASGKTIEISEASVDAVRFQVAARSLDSALQDRQFDPSKEPRIDPEHRRILVRHAEALTSASVERAATVYEPRQDSDRARIADLASRSLPPHRLEAANDARDRREAASAVLFAATHEDRAVGFPREADERRFRQDDVGARLADRQAIQHLQKAESIAQRLAKHDGAGTESPFTSTLLTTAYEGQKTAAVNQQQQLELQRQSQRGLDRG